MGLTSLLSALILYFVTDINDAKAGRASRIAFENATLLAPALDWIGWMVYDRQPDFEQTWLRKLIIVNYLSVPTVAATLDALIKDSSRSRFDQASMIASCAMAIIGVAGTDWESHFITGPPGHFETYRLMDVRKCSRSHRILVQLIGKCSCYRMLLASLIYVSAQPILAVAWMFIPAVIFTVLFYVGLDRLPMAGSVKRFVFSLAAGFAGPLCDMFWLEATPPFIFYAQALYPLRLLQVSLGLWIIAESRQERKEWNHTVLFAVIGMC